MKTLTILLLSLSLHQGISAQDDFNNRWTAAFKLASTEKYGEAIAAFEPLLSEQPDYAETHVQMAWCFLPMKQEGGKWSMVKECTDYGVPFK